MNELLIKKAQEVEKNIYDCDFRNVINDVIIIIQSVEKEKLLVNYKDKWSQIMNNLLVSFENKDFLVIADILRFELVPLIQI